MPEQEKTLRDTIVEASKQTQESSQAENVETKEGISEGDKGETQSGGTPEFVGGVDISDIPEQDRPRIKELLSKKMALADKGVQDKFREIATAKKQYEAMIADLEQHKTATTVNAQQQKASKLLDQLTDSVPLEQRESLRQLRQIISEETNVSELQKQVKDLSEALNRLAGDTVNTKRQRAETELSSLEGKYGKDIIERYKDKILDVAVQYNAPLRQVIHTVVPADELEQVILEKSKGDKKPLTQEKKNAISSNNATVKSAQKIETKNRSWKQILTEAAKK
jgi:FtsZ-binding cell division protein ZapB